MYRYGKMFIFMLTAFCMTTPLAMSACSSARNIYRAAVNSSATGYYKVGNPYEVDGKWYYPREDYSYNEVGVASWYGEDFHNGITANGERYDMHAMTAAHKTLPLPSIVKITNLENGRSVILRVNDRGPFVANRIIDVSRYAAEKLGFHAKGTTRVRVEIMPKESKELKQAMIDKEKWAHDAYKTEKYVYNRSANTTNNQVAYNNTNKQKAPVSPYTTSIRSVTTKTQHIRPTQEVYYGYKEEPVYVANLSDNSVYNVANGTLFVQTGAFSVKENAAKFAEIMKQYGNVSIAEDVAASGKMYKVRIGPFERGKDAEITLNRINDSGIYEGRIIDLSN